MAVKGTITTKGFEEFLERIAAAGKNVDHAAATAVQAGADAAKAGMQRRAPKDTHNLEQHLVVDGPHQDGNYVYAEVGLIGADADTARYGTAQEYGTAVMQAQPYIRPALVEDKAKIRKAMRESFNQELSEE